MKTIPNCGHARRVHIYTVFGVEELSIFYNLFKGFRQCERLAGSSPTAPEQPFLQEAPT
jgi:hypothetical protein